MKTYLLTMLTTGAVAVIPLICSSEARRHRLHRPRSQTPLRTSRAPDSTSLSTQRVPRP